ncbi:two-component regulator propeller domain-containing protein [Gaetbulibacter sp. M240]|uniref:hybrid sensor histidine kinase/response regulator transcription factor n=1 Tax=Gaetbulibacter sp. M240 TaxID=3126511 RepID=UPI00374E8984
MLHTSIWHRLGLILFLLSSLNIKGQEKIEFDHLTVENGLSHNGVRSIAQDSMGFMWFGTRDGLNRYDTQEFKIYKNVYNDSTSISSGIDVYALFCDSNGHIWAGTSGGLNKYLPKSNSFKRYVHDENDEQSISNNEVKVISEDKSGTLWVGTEYGLNKLTKAGKFERFFKKTFINEGLNGNLIQAIYPDKKGNIWVGTNEGITRMYESGENYQFQNFHLNPEKGNSMASIDITSITEDDKGNLWVGTHDGGFSRLNLETGQIENFLKQPGNENTVVSNVIRKILFDGENKLWITTLKGLSVYNLETGKFQNYQYDPNSEKSLSHNSVRDIFKDKSGSIWLATFFGGISVYHPNDTPFKVYQFDNSKNSISGNIVSQIAEDKKHNLWIGTEGEGLNYYDRSSGYFKVYKNNASDPTSINYNLIKAISIDQKGLVWVGSHEGGLEYFDSDKNEFINYKPNPNNPNDLFSKNIYNLFHDSQGRFWVGTFNSGLYLYDERKKSFKSLRLMNDGLKLDVNNVNQIYEDSKKNIWISTKKGLYVLKKGSAHFSVFDIDFGVERNQYEINFVQEDTNSNLWIGTQNIGLIKFSNGQQVARFTEKDGLPSSNVLGMIEDEKGNLWISTNNGLSKYNGNKFKKYTVEDGLPGNVFNNNASFIDSRGELFFGTYNGLVSFFPDDILENQFKPKLVFTNLKLFNDRIRIDDSSSLLNKSITYKNELTFSHDQNIFTLEFALLNFKKSIKNSYAYKLDGYDKEWTVVDKPSATFSNLPSGTYTLLVKAANNDGIGNEKPIQLQINVRPPFWATWWAYLLYFIFISSLLFIVTRYFLIKSRLKREHEVNQMKLDFFTEISHEIRTPLTLISGPLENLVNYDFGSDFMSKQFETMKNNVHRLSRLVNELMDFRKLEEKKMNLRVRKTNLVSYVESVYISFKYLALDNNVTYTFNSDKTEIQLYFDDKQLEKVLFNLISNAFKSLLDNGKVEITIRDFENEVEVRVSDNGKGVPKSDREKIFTNFYQINDEQNKNIGTGIGLAISKKIAELHHGSLILEKSGYGSLETRGSTFVLKLKKGKMHFSEEEIKNTPKENLNIPKYILPGKPISTKKVKPLNGKESHKYSVLLVEDNQEIREFVKSSLSLLYNVYEAENGEEGWEIAVTEIPDLIVSDVMMPKMNGLELCEKLKSDERTNHIPVILLTARSGDTHKITGLKLKADVYLTKPFSTQELVLNIDNLLSLSEKMRIKFSKQMRLEPTNVIIDNKEHEFISRVLDEIEKNIGNTEFGVHDLAAEIGMSSPVFYKKIKFLTGMSVNNFMKSVKLKRAAQLLKEGDFTVYQVAFEVGFKDSKYFSREFRKEFGKSPSDYSC